MASEQDENWREFVGMNLILVREKLADRVSTPLLANLDAALVRAAEGAFRRNVAPEYTNIASMSVVLLDYVGAHFNRPEMVALAANKAERIMSGRRDLGIFSEYNSPTYYGVSLFGFSMARAFGSSPSLRDLGRSLEILLWEDIAATYHPRLRSFVGPSVRRYGMNEREYVALAGVWIGLAVGDLSQAPLPRSRELALSLTNGIISRSTPCLAPRRRLPS
jgi:hypothetical protein